MKQRVMERFATEFGGPTRETKKVKAWKVRDDMGVVVELDQPKSQDVANVWLPFPPDNQSIPDFAFQYPGESGRHSNTYASPGLKCGLPALKLIVKTDSELDGTVEYIKAMRNSLPLPEVKSTVMESDAHPPTVNISAMPVVETPKPRREAIPRAVQREVWQRDGGRCVECSTREKLCFDHIVPFSRGGSNTVRNLQLLCESCNSSKGNRF